MEESKTHSHKAGSILDFIVGENKAQNRDFIKPKLDLEFYIFLTANCKAFREENLC